MKNQNIRRIAYLGLYAALYVVLKFVGNFIPFLQMPQGGSIEIELAVLFVASFHMGWKNGLVVALIGFLLSYLISIPWFLNVPQFMLDYIVPLAIVAVSGIFTNKGKAMQYVAIAFAMIIKYASQVLSGAIYWPPEGAASGSTAAWIFSINYNLWYNLATMVVCMILVPILLTRLQKSNVLKKI